nr:4Fe-4S dicluster domain-containing protein [uncultured Sellimonas sp.]
MRNKRYAQAEKERCVSCGACIKVCPKDAISIWKGSYAVMNENLCVGCGKCEKTCPAGCIILKERATI